MFVRECVFVCERERVCVCRMRPFVKVMAAV